MSELIARLQTDLNTSRKAKDKAGTLLLGTILADIKNRRIELMRDLTDDDAREVLRKGIKRRREAIEMYDKANRTDLASRERDEVTRLESYLPAAIGDDEIRVAVRAAIASGATTIGALMGKVMPQFKGRADGSAINRIAREELPK
ncbi:MAG TPA: GatB/YqeY domain-containing protein [Gemmatimonadaceae bacterium]|nr:GatB/YqeY domain-containing protein [Gemmatimonadaceae bacterium]